MQPKELVRQVDIEINNYPRLRDVSPSDISRNYDMTISQERIINQYIRNVRDSDNPSPLESERVIRALSTAGYITSGVVGLIAGAATGYFQEGNEIINSSVAGGLVSICVEAVFHPAAIVFGSMISYNHKQERKSLRSFHRMNTISELEKLQ